MPIIAAIQRPPVLLDRVATLARAVESLNEAADHDAKLVVFPETYIPGYPEWVWRTKPGDVALAGEIHRLLLASAVDLAHDDLAPLRTAAKKRGVTVVCGVQEIDGAHSRATLYNTVVVIGDDGEVKNRHRKLVATNPVRMVWGAGDGSGLRVVETPSGRVGGLICWENYMPLARFALYAQGIEIYVAPTWDQGEHWLNTMRHIAREGRTWVVGCAIAMQAKDIAATFPGRAAIYPDDEEWLNSGDSVVVDPTGKIAAGPLHRERAILYADCDPSAVALARRTLDVAGHYNRPDVFDLRVNRAPLAPIAFRDGDG